MVKFNLTYNANTITLTYPGILPDLFREGQGSVAMGKLSGNGVFQTEQVLAMNDENNMPPEVVQALETTQAGDEMPFPHADDSQ